MSEVVTKCILAKEAELELSLLPAADKNEALQKIAVALENNCGKILAANRLDMDAAHQAGVSQALLDRLELTEKRIQDMAFGVRQVCELQDPVGELLSAVTRPNGLRIEKIRVPLGVLGMIYEARPNVTVDAAVLALKTGNAIVLRGSSTAINSNKSIVAVIHQALQTSKIAVNAVQLIEGTDRGAVNEMMRLKEYIDVLIPRGGAELIKNVVENSIVPVLETGVGNCHVYVDASAQLEMAIEIVVNAKTHRPAVCNAAETLLINQDFPQTDVIALLNSLKNAGVEIRGCGKTQAICPQFVVPATEDDWSREYGDLIMAVKIVADTKEAISHIAKYGTKHTEAIVTENLDNAKMFMQMVDAAAVNHNASTRFTDGFEYGFGAEIGISTQKLHARGPMGLPELTSYKYLVYGNGQIRK